MDGQTLALTAPDLLQQARFEYGYENDEEVYKESFLHSIVLVQFIFHDCTRSRPRTLRHTAHKPHRALVQPLCECDRTLPPLKTGSAKHET